MKKLLETPAMQFELPDGLDYIFDNTPLSESDKRKVEEYIKKSKAKIRRRERYNAQKTQKNLLGESAA